jgi:hypothetical protein
MHDDGYIEAASELAGGGEVIRVRVRIDRMTDTQTVARSKRQVPIDLAQLWIDQRCGATLSATDEIRPATTRSDLFEQHGGSALGSDWRIVPPSRSGRVPDSPSTAHLCPPQELDEQPVDFLRLLFRKRVTRSLDQMNPQ